MHLRYEFTMDDVLAFTRFHYANSPTVKKAIYGTTWAVAALLLIGFLWYGLSIESQGFLIMAPIGAGLFVLIYPPLQKWGMERQTVSLYAEGKNNNIFGPKEMEIVEDGIISRGEKGESKVLWSGIERVAFTPEHAFIYVGPLMALIIPRKRITEGDYDAFLRVLEQNCPSSTKAKTGRAA